MQFTTTILAATALVSAVSAGPILARQVCGAAPGGTAAQTPLSQPSGITTAADCATQCKANPSCQSFLFGLSNGADQCELFSVPASSVPAQNDLVAYDIGCSSFPSIVPTASNPTGVQQQQHKRQQNGAPGGNTGANNNGGAATSNSGANNGAATANQGTHANPMNAVPAGNPTPIATPAANSLAACLAACQGQAACVAYTFVSGTCKLFS